MSLRHQIFLLYICISSFANVHWPSRSDVSAQSVQIKKVGSVLCLLHPRDEESSLVSTHEYTELNPNGASAKSGSTRDHNHALETFQESTTHAEIRTSQIQPSHTIIRSHPYHSATLKSGSSASPQAPPCGQPISIHSPSVQYLKCRTPQLRLSISKPLQAIQLLFLTKEERGRESKRRPDRHCTNNETNPIRQVKREDQSICGG